MELTQVQFQVPVLKQKKDNPALRIKIAVAENVTVTLSSITLGTAGTTDLKDIQQVRVYYYGRDSAAGNMQQVSAPVFAATDKIAAKIEMSGQQFLQPGDHYLWVSFELNEKAPLLNRVAVQCLDAVINDKRVNGGKKDDLTLRIGSAVRQHNQDGVHTSRIPGLATTNKGTLLVIFDARYESSRDLQGHMDIGLHRSVDGGDTWESLQIVMDRGEWGGLPQQFNGVSDACILVDKNSGAIYIAGLWMHGVINEAGKWVEGLDSASKEWNHQWRNKGSQPGFGVKQTSQFLIVKSTDDGKTWSAPVNITGMCKKAEWWLFAPAPGQGITLTDGTLVFPTQGRNGKGEPFSNITYSKDGGVTWHTSVPALTVPGGTTECAVAQLSDGSLMLNMRANRNRGNTGNDNGRAIAVTRDLGKTWSEHPSSFGALREPTCMASLHNHQFTENGSGKNILLFSNPDSKTSRDHITIKTSRDDGLTWPDSNWLLLDEWKGSGYSCLTSVDENHIGILYESSQADLVFEKISVNELLR